MPSLRFDPEQRFTCSQCGRCCRRPWEIALTPMEAETYRKAGAAAWYRETQEGPEGTYRDPFEPIPGQLRFHRIRKRSDGACGFLSPQNRCRIHEELGGSRKPLTCRMFPYRFHPADGGVVVTTSFCCPTTAQNAGEAVTQRELRTLQTEWFGVYPEKAAPLRFVAGRSIDAATLEALRSVLREMLDRPAPDGGPPDLRANVRRMAHMLEDLSRYRVLRLTNEAFAEYLALTGRYAAASEKPLPPRSASRVGRLLFRGFFFVVAATRLQAENKSSSGLRLGLRLKLFRLLAHFHGLGPPVSGLDIRAAREPRVRLEDPGIHPVARHYLRSAVETLGTGRRPVLDELALAVAFLNAACALASMRASQLGQPSAGREVFVEALMEAVDLTHADDRGALGSLLGTLASGVESLYLFASGGWR
jgi:Fe-S-cluster containining protein